MRSWAAGLTALCSTAAVAQVPPGTADIAAYSGLHEAAARDDAAAIARLAAGGASVEARDGNDRTALHVAAFASSEAALRALVAAGADPNAQERQRYDIVTIAAVADDVPFLEAALAAGASPRAITSPYDGTALIAAAHLGHVEVVRTLIRAGAPLDHVNNLGWTALIEAIVLGDGGARHTATVQALVEAGAALDIAEPGDRTPLDLARGRGYAGIVAILKQAVPR